MKSNKQNQTNDNSDEISQPKQYKRVKVLYRHQTKKGIIYSENQSSVDINNMNGFSRVYFTNGTYLEGVFQNGQSNQATYYGGSYLQGWITAKWNKEKCILGQGEQYTSRGQFLYQGQFENCARHGKGKQHFFSGGFVSGRWNNGLKEGPFDQCSNDYSMKGTGNYQKDIKVGDWLYKLGQESKTIHYGNKVPKQSVNNGKVVQTNDRGNNHLNSQSYSDGKRNQTAIKRLKQINNNEKPNLQKGKKQIKNQLRLFSPSYTSKNTLQQADSNYFATTPSQTLKQNKISTKQQSFSKPYCIPQKISNPFQTHIHHTIVPQTSLNKVKQNYRMLDDVILSSWSMILQYYLAYSKNDSVIVFPIELMKYYSGIDLRERQYKNVKYYTKHYSQNYNIFTFPFTKQRYQKRILLIPIIKHAHFTLAVVEIIKNLNQDIKFQCLIYDSLRSNSVYSTTSNSSRYYDQYYTKNTYRYQQKSNNKQQRNYSHPEYNDTWKAVKSYLIDELKQKINSQQQKQRYKTIYKSIEAMKLCYPSCPAQQDGVSCGVFVCIFMLYFCLNKSLQIPTYISSTIIKKFRTQTLYEFLSSQQINFNKIPEILKQLKY